MNTYSRLPVTFTRGEGVWLWDEAGKRYAGGDKSALKEAARNGRAYADLLMRHIDKEDNILYVMADRAMTQAEQKDLAAKFAEVEKERMGPARRQRYVALVEALEKEVGLR